MKITDLTERGEGTVEIVKGNDEYGIKVTDHGDYIGRVDIIRRDGDKFKSFVYGDKKEFEEAKEKAERMVKSLTEGNDLSELPHDVFSELEKKIKEGAKDLEQDWANALELVHKAYEVLQVSRPTPSMQAGWSQYENLITLAVQQLAKFRGTDGDWRHTSADS